MGLDALLICIIGVVALVGIFALAAALDAPGRTQWHRLASQVGLQAETFFRIGRIRLYGDFQGHYVNVEQYWTPDPQDPRDEEKGLLWTRIQMATQNPRQSAFMFGRSDVLNHAAGGFAKQFKDTTSVTLGNPESSQTFFVKESAAGRLQSLLERNPEMGHTLATANTPYFIQLEGSQLSYFELGSELMDKDETEKSAGRLKLTLSLLKDIAQQVEMPALP